MTIRLHLCGLTGGGDLGTQPYQFLVEVLLARKQFGQFTILGIQLGLLRLQLRQGAFQYVVAAGQQRGIERHRIGRLAVAGISASEPEADVKQLLNGPGRVTRADALFLMDGAIAQRVDVARLGKDRLAGDAAETRLV